MTKMSQKTFLEMLIKAQNTPNFYCNTPEKNLGYHWSNGKFSFDCWNLIKAVIAGWDGTNPVGTKVEPKVTGDIDGLTMLKKCSGRSKDFKSLTIPGTYLYIYSSPHAGIYVGNTVIAGKTYNVIECTGAWNGGVLYTYVDEKGCRYQYKGGPKNRYSWEEHGLLPWIDYEAVSEQPSIPDNTDDTEEIVVYTVVKGDTLSTIASKYNIPLDKLIKANPNIPNPNRIYIGQKIKVPVKTQQESTSADKGEQVFHVVQRNETLSGIAKKYNTNYLKLAAMNGIVNPNKIYIGQKIRVK